jgi:hypothetical protein
MKAHSLDAVFDSVCMNYVGSIFYIASEKPVSPVRQKKLLNPLRSTAVARMSWGKPNSGTSLDVALSLASLGVWPAGGAKHEPIP